ncbi:MAG: acetyltransferase [Candidatus Eremiobacteraeota bacterium]|nr:acetyltransferase [Candidatus Eremiobacteraeota bacterium]
MKRAIIFGTTDFAQVASVYLREDGGYEVEAFTVDRRFIEAETLLGLPVVPFEDVATAFPPGDFAMFVGIGYSKVNKNRRDVYEACKALGYTVPTYVHSTVIRRPETKIGDGCFIFEENVVQPFVTIGDNCVLWSGNHIGHHTKIGNNVFIASHVVISGRCTIGDNCFIGVNATFRDGVTIGRDGVIGAGTIILGDTEEAAVYKGPATEPLPRRSDELRKI